ncbi:hypothetical protein [Variovorax boronicumulans]|uniref:hypothetical protein n=1 Tax=Variovorax boronicumulans TaxID=436515 RepID=UPI0012E44E10|nr:hypothetical protein [Variovorax boronicumulans]GER16734.1 hypothetical protein VCH24_17410 [Variovorax boronicumulans]
MAYASVLGLGVMVLAASIVLLFALGAAWWLVGLLGNEVYKRLRRTYHLTVIGYWLDRLEKGGMREFQKAEEYDEALKKKGVTRPSVAHPVPVAAPARPSIHPAIAATLASLEAEVDGGWTPDAQTALRKLRTLIGMHGAAPVQQAGTVEAAHWIEQALQFVCCPSWSSSHYVAGKTILAALKGSPTACDATPAGWRCARAKGHEGPCAAIPTTDGNTR